MIHAKPRNLSRLLLRSMNGSSNQQDRDRPLPQWTKVATTIKRPGAGGGQDTLNVASQDCQGGRDEDPNK